MDEDYKFTKIIMFYFVKNKTYNKWITNNNNNTITTTERKSTVVMGSKKHNKEDQKNEIQIVGVSVRHLHSKK
jgi:hypothetical protein